MTPAVLEKRRNRRYALQADLQYLALDPENSPQIGKGCAHNMSRTGLFFRPNVPLPNDWRCCAVAVKWPARPTATATPPVMVIFGYPVRIAEPGIALSVSHHVFLRMEADDDAIASLLLKIGSEKSAAVMFRRRSAGFRPALQLIKRNTFDATACSSV